MKVDLGNNLEAQVKNSELGEEAKSFEIGQAIEAKILNLDRKNRIISLYCLSLEEKLLAK